MFSIKGSSFQHFQKIQTSCLCHMLAVFGLLAPWLFMVSRLLTRPIWVKSNKKKKTSLSNSVTF